LHASGFLLLIILILIHPWREKSEIEKTVYLIFHSRKSLSKYLRGHRFPGVNSTAKWSP
jgi:hypothetical protein